jgi:acyl dehydratase
LTSTGWIHENRALARTASGHRRTVGGGFFTSAGGMHVVLDAAARVCSRQTHIVELTDDTLHQCKVGEVRPA